MIARDELAARCLVALLSNAGRVGHGSNVVDAVTCADALIARLASRSPASPPATYVPKVGDVVALSDYDAHRLIVVAVEGNLWRGKILYDKHADGSSRVGDSAWQYGPGAIFDRPATAAERAAAGLPVDEAKPSVVSTCCLCGRSLVDQRCKNRYCTFYDPTRLPVDEATTPLRTASPNVVDRTPPAATPAYPVDDKGRPLWVRFVADHSNDKAMPRRVLEWDGDVATVEGISPHRKPNGCKPSAKAGEWEPCAAPAETPAAALTEEERADLRDAIWKERTAWLATGADQRSEPDVYANAAAAWFAKRDGTVKP